MKRLQRKTVNEFWSGLKKLGEYFGEDPKILLQKLVTESNESAEIKTRIIKIIGAVYGRK